MEPLTSRQQEILGFISDVQASKGTAPTLREIAQAFGVSIPTIQGHLRLLKKKGCLSVESGVHRGIRVARRRREWEVQQEWREQFEDRLGGRIRGETELARIASIVSRDVKEWLEVDRADLFVYDPRRRGLAPAAAPEGEDAGAAGAPGDGPRLADTALRLRRPQVVSASHPSRSFASEAAERPGLMSCAAIPILGRDRVLGVLRLDDRRSAGRFDDDMIARAALAVTSLAHALEQGTLNATLQRRIHLQGALMALCRSIRSTRDIQRIFRDLYFVVNDLIDAPALIVAVRDESSRWWLLLESDLIDGKPWVDATPHAVDIGKNEALRAIQLQPYYLKHRTAVEVRDLESQGAGHTPDGWLPIGNTARRSRSFLYVPLKVGDRMVGYLSAQSYAFDAYTVRDAEELMLVAEYVGLAVQTAWREEGEWAKLEAAERALARLDRMEEELRHAAAGADERARVRLAGMADDLAALRSDRKAFERMPRLPGA